jgi:hypothetical protein
MNTNDNNDLASIQQALDILRKVVENPEKYKIIESQADLGSSRQLVDEEHALQRVGLGISFIVVS